MNRIFNNSGGSSKPMFNMTPVIDIVFLLIVFLVVVCHFIETEDLVVQVPDKCDLSEDDNEAQAMTMTVTLTKRPDGEVEFVLGKDKLNITEIPDLSAMLADEIDSRLCDYPDEQRIITLRIDKSITFRDVKHILAGVSASDAGYVRLATLKNAQAEQGGP